MKFDPRVMLTEYPGEELWVQTLAVNQFEIGIQLNKQQYTYLNLTKEQLTKFRENIDAALLEAIP